MTLAEVLIVVALMAILLGLAMPDLISQARRIKHAELDNNARAVAVAVQSRLYGLRNSANADYKSFNTLGSSEIEVELYNADGQPIEDEVRWAANFPAIVKGEEDEAGGSAEPTEDEQKAAEQRAEIAKKLVFSGALTELDLLEKGKILIVYKPATGDIVYAFYSESEFDVGNILTLIQTQSLDEQTLFALEIGYYFGEDAPDPLMNESLPRVSLNFSYDDEMVLEILIAKPKEMYENTPLAIEIFISNDKARNKKMLIYSEGLFAKDQTLDKDTSKAKTVTTIKADKPLCFANMPKETKAVTIGGETVKKPTGRYHLRFAIDSLVVTHVYEQFRPYLLHNSNPYAQDGGTAANSTTFDPGSIDKDELGVSVAQELLYPRNEFSTWMGQSDFSVGITDVGKNNLFTQEWIKRTKKENNDTGTMDDSDYHIESIPIDGQMSLSVELHALKQSSDGAIVTTEDGIREFDDAAIAPAKATSLSANPYFRQIDLLAHTAWLGSIRELSNLNYIFKSANIFTNARLWSNIEGEQFFQKLCDVRETLFDKEPNGEGYKLKTETKFGKLDYMQYGSVKQEVELKSEGYDGNVWAIWANSEQTCVAQMTCTKDNFVLDGANPYYNAKKPKDGVPARFVIRDIGLGASGSPWASTGLFSVIKNGTFKNLELVNTFAYMNVFERNFLGSERDNNQDNNVVIKGTNRDGIEGLNGFAGTLCAFAVDCKFENVYVYNDSSRLLPGAQNSSVIRVAGICAGGICGIAIGSGNAGTNGSTGESVFNNCLASTRIIANMSANGQTCVYGGGLSGITMGNVKISGCYAAGQIGAYYSGGLVGRVISKGKWDYGKDPTDSTKQKELKGEFTDSTKTTEIKDSFAAGQIYRYTRVGGGLIAKNDYTSATGEAGTPVSGCYAAVWYEAVPPVVFGTFEGDTLNYYVYQTAVNVPITSFVEASFTFTGKENDLFRLGKEGEGPYNGIACNVKELNEKFITKTEGTSLATEDKSEAVTTWKKITNTNTHRYAYNGSIVGTLNTLDSADSYQLGYREYGIDEYFSVGMNNGENHDLWTNQINLSAYPFPIQSHFADFYGDWIKRYVRYDSGYTDGSGYHQVTEWWQDDGHRDTNDNRDKIGKVLLPARDEGESTTSTTNAATNNGYTFHGYYYLCYFLSAGATNNHVDPGAITTHSLTYDNQTKIVLSTEGEKKVAQTKFPSNNSDWGTAVPGTFNPKVLYREVKDVTPTAPQPATASEWFLSLAEEAQTPKVYEHGTYGATGVSTDGSGNLVFTDVPFFSKDFDPVKGIKGLKIKTKKGYPEGTISAFLAAADGGENAEGEEEKPDPYKEYSYSNGEIYWDYRGFYVMAIFDDESHREGNAYMIFYLVDSTEFASSSALVSAEPSEDGVIDATKKGYVAAPYGNSEITYYYVDVDFDQLKVGEKHVTKQEFKFNADGKGVTPQWDSTNNCIVVKGSS